jgi:tyrosine phenol-lyase
MAGGQPISLHNLKEVRKMADQYGIAIVHDMTRVAENAFMIQQHEPGYLE